MPLPGWLAKVFGGGIGEVAGTIMDGVAKMGEGHLGKKELRLEIEKLLAARDMANAEVAATTIRAKERILVAELQQGDSYTKRARPTIVYAGLVGILLEGFTHWTHFVMPAEFWYVWGGICSVWIVGRSAEKRGARGQVVDAITGGSSRLLGL